MLDNEGSSWNSGGGGFGGRGGGRGKHELRVTLLQICQLMTDQLVTPSSCVEAVQAAHEKSMLTHTVSQIHISHQMRDFNVMMTCFSTAIDTAIVLV